MEEILCIICFNEFDEHEKKNKCINKNCTIYICTECLEVLITHSCRDGLLPKCPGNNCDSSYTLSCMRCVDKSIIKIYEIGCLNYFLQDNGDIIKKKLAEQNMIINLRQERLKFIDQQYPKGIALIAKITFKDKLKKMDKQKQEIIGLILKKSKKSCINNFCNGYLNEQFECVLCENKFCIKCERKLNDQHVCKQTDLDSINLVNGMIKCPNCKLPVFKNEGCDNITCSNCQTKFIYSTGKIGGSGSVNAKIKVNVDKKNLLSIEHRNKLAEVELELILKIESLEPPIKSKNILLTPIKMFIQNPSLKNKCAADLAKKIDIYAKSQNKIINYNKYIIYIDEIIMTGKKNDKNYNFIGKLNEIIELLK